MVSLLDGQTATYGTTINSTQVRTRGVSFRITENTFLTRYAWHRPTTTGSVIPSRLSLWDGNGDLIHSVEPVPDDGLVGYQWVTLPTPVAAYVGDTFRVAACWPVNASYGRFASAMPAPTPFSLEQNYHVSHDGSCAFPELVAAGFLPSINVDSDSNPPPDPPPGGATPGQVSAELAKWLHPTLATEPEAPADVGYIPEALLALKAWLTSDGDGLAGKVGLMQTYPALGPKSVAEGALLIYNIVKALQDLFGTPSGPETDAAAQSRYLTLGAYMADTLHADHTAILAALSAVPGVGSFPTGWTMLDETTWDTFIAWPQVAHLYVATITDYPAGWSRRELGDVVWLPRAAWWTPLNGTQGGERKYLDLQTQQLHVGGAQMPGVLLASHPGFLGTLQAWEAP